MEERWTKRKLISIGMSRRRISVHQHIPRKYIQKQQSLSVLSLEEYQKIIPRLILVDRAHVVHAPPLTRGPQFRLAYGMSIHVLDQYRGTEGRSVMDARTSIGMTTGADFEVEWTIDLILLRAVNACQVSCCHFYSGGRSVGVPRRRNIKAGTSPPPNTVCHTNNNNTGE